jgi:hypothetical protein
MIVEPQYDRFLLSVRINRNLQLHEIFWRVFDWVDIHPVVIKIIDVSEDFKSKCLEPEEVICGDN